jgi:proteasome accessory factor B
MSVRTIKRDIDFMKNRLDLPIEFNVERNGYFFTKSVPHFPQMPMSEADTFALFIANKAIEQYRGTPLQQMLEATFRKLTGQLDEGMRFSLGNLDGVLSFRPFAPGDAELKTFALLTRAVSERRAVRFHVSESGTGEGAVAARASLPHRVRRQPVVPLCVRSEAEGHADVRAFAADQGARHRPAVRNVEEVRFE